MRNIPVDNAKHEHFCQLIANGENNTQAYVLAGYSEKGAAASAARLLKNADICDRIAFLRNEKEAVHREAIVERIERSQIDAAWIEAKLVDAIDMGMQAVPVLDSEGAPTGEYKQNLPAAIKALELLGINRGLFVKKTEVGKPGDFADLADDELARQIKETERQIVAAGGSVH